MTLKEGKDKVLKLLDEYDLGGSADEDLEARLADFFDTAQKEVAKVKKIVKIWEIEREPGVTEYAMPADFMSLRSVWIDGKKSRRLAWRAGKLIIPESDGAEAVEVEYNAVPATVNNDTAESYEFELAEDAAQVMPFYVAAQALAADFIQDYNPFWMMYQNALATLEKKTAGDGAAIQNRFYGGF